MEKPWLDDRVTHNLHWDGYGEHHKHEGTRTTVPGLMDGWHTFGLLWLPGEYVFYVDGKETWRSKAGGVCQVPQYMLLSDEIGSWAGDITKAKLPDQFVVDYVRVYDFEEDRQRRRQGYRHIQKSHLHRLGCGGSNFLELSVESLQ